MRLIRRINLETDNLGWAWFGQGDPAEPNLESHVDGGLELDRAYARCFGTAEGDRVIAHLRAITFERVVGPNVSEAFLRHLEGQRHLVAFVCSLIERGRNGAASQS